MAREKRQQPPRFYFNLRSPYSWLAQHDLRERYPDVAGALDWRPFWEPDERSDRRLTETGGRFLYTPMSKEKHLYILQDVRRLADERGLQVSWPIDKDPCWEVAHLPYFLAVEVGQGHQYVAAVSGARWQHGQDITNLEVITGIAAELDLDAARVRSVDTDDQVAFAATSALMDLYRDCVFGVPYFVLGPERYWGIDRLPAFVARVRETLAAQRVGASEEEREVPVAELSGVSAARVDDGHAGGCG